MIRIIRLRQPNSVQTIYACWGMFMICHDRYIRVTVTSDCDQKENGILNIWCYCSIAYQHLTNTFQRLQCESKWQTKNLVEPHGNPAQPQNTAVESDLSMNRPGIAKGLRKTNLVVALERCVTYYCSKASFYPRMECF